MKSLIVLVALVAVCAAIPQGMMGSQLQQQSSEPRKPPVPILKFEYNNDNNGVYSVSSQGGDQTQVQEKGEPRDLGDKEGPVIVKSGSFSYVGTDGLTYSVNWVADQEGFKPQGSHLPTTPAPL